MDKQIVHQDLKEHKRQYTREYYRRIMSDPILRQRRKDRDREYHRGYRNPNETREQHLFYVQRYKDSHKDAIKKYRLQTSGINKLQAYKKYDAKRGLLFNLTYAWFKEYILNKACTYCGLEDNSKMGCDRINNEKGHTMENCLPCCTNCNLIRSNKYSVDEMRDIGKVLRKIRESRRLGYSYQI